VTILAFVESGRPGCDVASGPTYGTLRHSFYLPSSNLSSCFSVLDPILYDLLDPSVRRIPSATRINGKQLQSFSYERPFDQTYVNYLLETLLSVVKFGGQGFGKTARMSMVRKSHSSELVERILSGEFHRFSLNGRTCDVSFLIAGLTDPDVTYQDVLLEVLTRYVPDSNT